MSHVNYTSIKQIFFKKGKMRQSFTTISLSIMIPTEEANRDSPLLLVGGENQTRTLGGQLAQPCEVKSTTL